MINYCSNYFLLLFFSLTNSILIFGQNTILGTGTNNNGSSNTMIGYNAGHVNTASVNTFVGSFAGANNTTGWLNCFIGASSGEANSTGSSNTFLGYGSGRANTKGGYNTIIGAGAGQYVSTGGSNTFLGASSGAFITNSSGNSALGTFALFSCSTGNNNTAVGNGSGHDNLGSGNVFLGYQSGYNETGSNKLYISNSLTSTPLIYGDFSSKQVGINALTNGTHTLNVGGTINATGVYVNGILISGDTFWTKVGNNVTTNSIIGVGTPLTNNPNGYMFAINGKIGAKEVQIENTSTTWPDYVFNSDYKLMPLTEVENFIKANGHLPEVPSEEQVKAEGIKVYEMNAKLLQKIEELTLHLIDANKRIDKLTEDVKKLQDKNDR